MGVNQIWSEPYGALFAISRSSREIWVVRGRLLFLLRGSVTPWGLESLGLQAQSQDIETLQTQKIERSCLIIGVSPDEIPQRGWDSYPQIIDAIDRGEIKALWVVATNPLVSFPDQNKIREAFKKLDMLVVQDAFVSETVECCRHSICGGYVERKRGFIQTPRGGATTPKKR